MAKRQARFPIAVRLMPRGVVQGAYIYGNGYAVPAGVPLDGPVRTFLSILAGMEKWPDHIEGHPPVPLHRDLEEDGEAYRVFANALASGHTFLDDIIPDHRTEAHMQVLKMIRSVVKQILREEAPVEQILCSVRDHVNEMLAPDSALHVRERSLRG